MNRVRRITRPAWRADAVIVVAYRARMLEPVLQTCRDCGTKLVVDYDSIAAAVRLPVRGVRPVECLCVECATQYDPTSIDYLGAGVGAAAPPEGDPP